MAIARVGFGQMSREYLKWSLYGLLHHQRDVRTPDLPTGFCYFALIVSSIAQSFLKIFLILTQYSHLTNIFQIFIQLN